MTTFDDPNREAIGLEPIWTGADTSAPAPEGDDEPDDDAPDVDDDGEPVARKRGRPRKVPA